MHICCFELFDVTLIVSLCLVNCYPWQHVFMSRWAVRQKFRSQIDMQITNEISAAHEQHNEPKDVLAYVVDIAVYIFL